MVEEGHGTRKKATLDEIERIIESPKEIYAPENPPGSYLNYYIGQLDDGTWVVLKVYMGKQYKTPPHAPNYNRYSTETGHSNTLEGVRNFLKESIREDVKRIYPRNQ